MSEEQNTEITDSETTSNEEQVEKPVSTRDAIDQAFKELESRAATPKTDTPAPEAPKPNLPEKSKTTEKVETPLEAKAPIEETQKVIEQPKDDKPPIPAPKFLDAEKRARFDKLPYEAKELVASIEYQTRRWGSQIAQEVAETRKLQKELDGVLSPHANYLKLNNVAPVQAVDHLLTNAVMLDQNPKMMLARYMQQYGLTPYDFLDGNGAPVQQQQSGNGYYQPPREEYSDPRADDALKRVESIEERLREEAQAREQQRQQALLGEIEAFKSETDANGQPLRPHFDRFRTQIGRLVDELEAEKPWLTPPQLLNEAYSKVVSEIEETFVKPRLANGQFAAKDQKQVEQSKRAEAAAGSLSGSSLGSSKQRKYSQTSDAMREAARELGMNLP